MKKKYSKKVKKFTIASLCSISFKAAFLLMLFALPLIAKSKNETKQKSIQNKVFSKKSVQNKVFSKISAVIAAGTWDKANDVAPPANNTPTTPTENWFMAGVKQSNINGSVTVRVGTHFERAFVIGACVFGGMGRWFNLERAEPVQPVTSPLKEKDRYNYTVGLGLFFGIVLSKFSVIIIDIIPCYTGEKFGKIHGLVSATFSRKLSKSNHQNAFFDLGIRFAIPVSDENVKVKSTCQIFFGFSWQCMN